MLDIFLRPSVAGPLLVVLSYVVYSVFFAKLDPLPDLPILNAREGEWFSRLKAKWRNTKDFKSAVMIAYDEYSKKDLACILPIAGQGNIILLPASNASFIVEQTDQVLSVDEPHIESLQTDRTMPDPILVRYPTHKHVITRDLTSQLGSLVSNVNDEIATDLSEQWGVDSSTWTEFCVYDSMRRLMGRTSNRVFVGAPLCRNQEFLDAGMSFAQDVPLASNLIRLFPKLLHPIVGPVLTLPNKMHTRTFFKYLVPEIQKRLEDFDRRRSDPESKSAEPEPNDYVQWTINYAKKSLPPSESDARLIAGRVLMLNFAAIHTSTFSMTHVLFDLIASDPKNLAELRTEVENVLAEDKGRWTKQGLSKMIKVDSALRESQRLNSFVTIGLGRQVVAKEGMTTPQGVHCPYGSMVAIPAYPVHQDNEIWPEAQKYLPFRFAEQRDEHVDDYIKKARLAFATTNSEYLAFGHGRHACPGRFFAANELKLMLAYMVLNYDFEMMAIRPKNQWLGLLRLPPMKATIKVKRRKVEN